MGCVQYTVSAGGPNEWTVKLEHRMAGPYREFDIAVRIAISEALQVRRTGRSARIMVHKADRTAVAVYRLCGPCTCEMAAVAERQGQLGTFATNVKAAVS